MEVGISGVKTVEVNRKQSKVTVNGYVDPNRVLNRIKSTGKRAEFWPYVPYNVVYYPHAPQAYDKRAPAGMVKNVAQAQLPPNATEEEKFAYLFSDDNPSACSIMWKSNIVTHRRMSTIWSLEFLQRLQVNIATITKVHS